MFKTIRKVDPYVPGEQPQNNDVIKLNTNENPYPPSPRVIEALESFDSQTLRLYPDFSAEKLAIALSKKYNLQKENFFFGNGSDEVIALCLQAFFASSEPILYPDVTYSFYKVWCGLFKIPYKTIPLKEDFTINIDDYLVQCGGIIFPNPNAPTSINMPLLEIEKILKAQKDIIVIIDEAYVDFGGVSAISLLEKYNNLIVVQTFSKSKSLAGLRLAFAAGNKELISVLENIKHSFNSYPVDRIAQHLGLQAILDDEYYKNINEKIIKTREDFTNSLLNLGFKTLPSSANFVFTTHENISAKELFNFLKEKNIYVRYFDKERLSDYLRITIGLPAEMDSLIDAIKEFITTKD